jgi:hypothetical protein
MCIIKLQADVVGIDMCWCLNFEMFTSFMFSLMSNSLSYDFSFCTLHLNDYLFSKVAEMICVTSTEMLIHTFHFHKI